MLGSDACARVLAAVDGHWRGEQTLARTTGLARAELRRCLADALRRGDVETPRGAYAGQLWRRAAPVPSPT